MRVLVTGGDGFIGWPTALRLSRRGHDVLIIDNYFRRRVISLTPIEHLNDRIRCWHELHPVGDLIDRVGRISHRWMSACSVMGDDVAVFEPEAIIHLAVQPSAPFSMRSAVDQVMTVQNNVGATASVLAAAAFAEKPPHIIHIGTMGVYGYGAVPGMAIPEGYVEVCIPLDGDGPPARLEILHPTSPGSVYHATKVLDQTLFAFYAKNYGLRITDLHQGVVWGTQTEETREDDRLINRFDYDGEFGTVLNRFLMQAAVGHPLTVHGTGGQTRAFINLNDSIACLELALAHPPQAGERVKIMNQMTEVHRVRDLAELVARLTGAEVSFVDNPRREAAENELSVTNTALRGLGLKPTLLADGLLSETYEIAQRFKARAEADKISATVRWTR
jgi:UDP-sulfoquinovose synthase